MKKIIKILCILVFLSISISFVSAINFEYVSPNIQINSLDQACYIQNNVDIYCNTLISFFVINRSDPNISITFIENLGSPHAEFEETKIKLCDWGSDSRTNDYKDFNVNCSSYQPFKKEINNSRGEITIKFNINDLKNSQDIYIPYTIKNFIVKDILYKNIFFNTYNLNSSIFRTIILPKGYAVQSLYNFKIIMQNSEGSWIIGVDKGGDATASFRDIETEKITQNKRDISIVFISLGFSIIFTLILSGELKKRTKNLWLLGGFFLLLLSFILFYNLLGTFWSILLIIFFVLLLSFFGLANSSRNLDTNSSGKRDKNEILKLIKTNKLKSFLLVFFSSLLIIFYLINNFILIILDVFLLFWTIALMKTNRPKQNM